MCVHVYMYLYGLTTFQSQSEICLYIQEVLTFLCSGSILQNIDFFNITFEFFLTLNVHMKDMSSLIFKFLTGL